jgi:hypothetical protein
MLKAYALSRRATAWIAAAGLLLAALAPLLLGGGASASQVTERKITLSSSKVGQTSVTYSVSFKPVSTSDIKGIVVDFCQNSPLVGVACTKTNGVTAVPTSGTVAVTHTGATGSPVSFNAVVGTTAQAGRLLLTHATGLTPVTAGNTITFSFTATNPSGTSSTVGAAGTFYARIVTFTSDATATNYDSTATGANNPGTHLDEGGIALSTAKQLTVNARVQEQLEFCVGSVDSTVNSNASAPANCSDAIFTGGSNDNTVDLGVVDSNAPSVSPVDATNGGDNQNGGVMIRTNAVNGAVITYFAEQNTSSGKLKVAGAACSGTSATDQCFNSADGNGAAGAQEADFATSATGEKFGMTAGKVLRPTGSTTTNLTRSTDYDGNGTATASACAPATVDSASCFTWDDTGGASPVVLASSNTVLDYEMLLLNFAARAAATTPTGSYTVTSTYIATATF